MITLEKTAELVTKFGRTTNDSGSPEVQVAILTERITNLSAHFASHKKDFSGQRGLMKMIGKRRSLLKYLASKDDARYKKVIAELNLRK